jgi:hypothetical protein
MQALIVVAMMVIIGFFTYMETRRNDIATPETITAFKSAVVAANIMQYNDILTQYIWANYTRLHENDYVNMNNVGKVTILDFPGNEISSYSQKNLRLFLNYSSAVFNYGVFSSDVDSTAEIARLYLITSFNNYVRDLPGYTDISLDHVMGLYADNYHYHIYQGSSVSWVIPILLKQDGACNVVEIYGQIPNDSNNMKQLNNIRVLFKRFCTGLQSNGYMPQKYVYIASIIENDH